MDGVVVRPDRVEVLMTGMERPQTLLLVDPPRIVLDFPSAALRDEPVVAAGAGWISSVRTGRQERGGRQVARVVVELMAESAHRVVETEGGLAVVLGEAEPAEATQEAAAPASEPAAPALTGPAALRAIDVQDGAIALRMAGKTNYVAVFHAHPPHISIDLSGAEISGKTPFPFQRVEGGPVDRVSAVGYRRGQQPEVRVILRLTGTARPTIDRVDDDLVVRFNDAP